MMRRIMVATTLALSLAACGSGPSDGEGASISTGSGTLTQTTRPDNLPAYVPVYPGATDVEGVVSKPDEGPGGGVMTLTTADPAAKVMAFYAKAAASQGLAKVNEVPQSDDGVWITFFNQPGTKRSFNVTTERAEGGAGTKVSIIYQ